MEPMTIVLVALAIVAVLVFTPYLIMRARGIASNIGFWGSITIAGCCLFFGGIWYIGFILYACFADKGE